MYWVAAFENAEKTRKNMEIPNANGTLKGHLQVKRPNIENGTCIDSFERKDQNQPRNSLI